MPLIFLVPAVLLLLLLAWVVVVLLLRKPRVGKILLAALLVAVSAGVLLLKPQYKTRTQRFAEDVKKAVAPSELQQWAATILQETSHTTSLVSIPAEQVPASIRNLTSQGSPFQDAVCDEGSVQNRAVCLFWGGGFGHWGIKVGLPSFKPDPGPAELYYLEWEPGIYFWHETH